MYPRIDWVVTGTGTAHDMVGVLELLGAIVPG